MAVLASYGTDGTIDINQLKSNLEKVEGIEKPLPTITSDGITVKVDGYEVTITGDGKVTVKGDKNEGTENPPEPIPEMSFEEAKNKERFETKTKVIDVWHNEVIIPEGFKIAIDSGDVASSGVVIEDATDGPTKGSQFVWVPVGTVSMDLTESDTRIIELSRYTFGSDGTPTAHGEERIFNYGDTYYQELATSSYGNTTAKNIEAFKTSVEKNGGYYIGRYEARTTTERTNGTDDSGLGQVTVKADDYVYDYVTQPQAAKLCREMYQNKSYTSDLINSYAWDTALVFIQKMGKENYSKETSLNNSLAEKGTNNLSDTTKQDRQCNIWDMASNCSEWSTETATNVDCVITRGGNSGDFGPSSERYNRNLSSMYVLGFRVILYL